MSGRGWRHRGWAVFLTIGLVVSGHAALEGSPEAIGAAVQLAGWMAAVIGLAIAVRSEGSVRRTWLCFTGAAALFLIGGIVRTVHGMSAGIERPFPSPADAFLVVGHGLLIMGSILLGHLRSPDRDRAAIADGAIVAAGAESLVWALLLWPYVTDASIPAPARALNGFYALLTTALLASIARLAVGPGARTRSYRILAIAVGLIFLQDLLVTVEYVGGPQAIIGRALAPFIFVFFGAAALHPTRRRITEAADSYDARLTWRRIVLLVSALLVNPAIIVVQLLLDREPTLWVCAVSSAIIGLLVLARLITLLRHQERATDQEQALRRANAELAVAPDRSTMLRAALDAAAVLTSPRPGVRASVVTPIDGRLEVTASTGYEHELALGHQVARVPWWADTDVVGNHDPIELVGPPVDVPTMAGLPEVWHYLVPLSAWRGSAAGTLVITAGEPLPIVVRRAIDALATTTALALEGAALAEDLQRARIERRFRALVENSSDLIVVVSGNYDITFISSASSRLMGYEEDTLIGLQSSRLPFAEDVDLLSDLLVRARTSSFTQPVEIRLRHRDGLPRWFEIAARDMLHDPQIEGIVLNCREVSDRKDAELRLHRSEARFRALVQNVSDVVAVIDEWGLFTYVSPAVTPLLGYEPERLIDTRATAILSDSDRTTAEQQLQLALGSLRIAPNPPSIELSAIALDGSTRVLDVTITDLRHDPAVQGIVLNARDVTVRRELESTLRHQAQHDALTGLANRTRFTDLVNAVEVEDANSACVLFIDLDDFKTENDSLGHAVGDELLIAVAERLAGSLPPEAVAARLGGDEFAVLVPSATHELGPVSVALRLLHELRTPFDINGWEIVVSASIGMAKLTGEADNAEVVLRNADMAMYLAKERGKDRVELFEEAMHATAFERLELKADLARAITSGQLTLAYQPIIALETGRITGAEALVRWNHPRRGHLSPASFIAIAEETGLIVQLGAWVLREACQQLRTWQLALPADAALSMSVNLSVRQLEHASVVQEVREVIDQFALDPSTLTLEITETVIIEHMETDRRRLVELKELGVQIALDDFGVGYSSLRYADDLPVDVIKVDRSFVNSINGPQATPVLEAIVALGRRLGVHTVAEGIETEEQLEVLKRIGCDLGQGFYFARPLSPEDFAGLLRRNLATGDLKARDGGERRRATDAPVEDLPDPN
jgi:diguanylate cyclase (GGDEF)-like protein/PAS domain S-box-containing protein